MLFCFLAHVLPAQNISNPRSLGTSSVDSANGLQNIGLPLIANFSAKKYQAHPNNFDVIQDSSGVMYFGNLWGIVEFNGTSWKTISLPAGVSCTSLDIDDDGTIYAGGRNQIGYLKKDSIGRKYFVSLLNKLPESDRTFNEVWRTYVTAEGIFFASYESLLLKKRNEDKVTVLRKSLWKVFKVKDHIYLADNTGLYHYQDETIIHVPNTDLLNGKFVNLLSEFGDKLMISTSEDGLFIYDGDRLSPWKAPINKILTKFNPVSMMNISNQYLVFTTELNGVYITDLTGNVLLNLNRSNGLIGNTVNRAFVDKDKNLWLMLNNGIAYVSMFKPLSYINNFSGVTGIAYSSAVYDDKLYLSTSEGLFYRSLNDISNDTKFIKFEGISGLIWNLTVIDDKLFCGHAITAQVIDHGKTESICNEGTWFFLPMKEKDRILIGTYNGIHILKKNHGRWKYFKKLKGFEESSRFIVQDTYGDLWIAHGNKGVFRLRLNAESDSITNINIYGAKNGLRTDLNHSVFKIDNEIVITSDSGVFYYDYQREAMKPYKPLMDINKVHGAIKKVVTRSHEESWMITEAGSILKTHLSPDKDLFTVVLKTEALRNDGVPDFEHLNVLTSSFALVGTQEGFAVYQKKDSTNDAESTYQAYISKVQSISDNKIFLEGCIADGNFSKEGLPYHQNGLNFTFSCNFYEDLSNIKYQYYLEGFDHGKRWSDWTYLPYKEYTNLDPGKYVLHVRSMNYLGNVSKEAVISFEIRSPWYRTLPAYALYAFMLILLGYGMARKIRKRFEAEQRKMELERQRNLWIKEREWQEASLKIEKEVLTLQQEKLLIETEALREKELLLQKEQEQERKILEIEKEKFEAEIHYKNNELTSLTLHITQKNEILAKIGSYVQHAIQELGEGNVSKSLQQIKELIQKGLNSKREWEKFSEHFNIVHHGFMQRLQQQYPDLSVSSLKLCAFIKMKLSSKQIAILMNTEPNSVVKARYRLRMKFQLEKDTGLEEFLNSF